MRRLLALSIVFSVLVLVGGAGAAQNPVERPPSLLWKSYPLKQRATVRLVHPLRPPAIAEGTGSRSGGGFVISPYLVMLAFVGGAMLALTGLLAKSLVKDVAGIATARRWRSAESEGASTEEAKPDMLVALHSASATAEVEEPESESEPSVSLPTVQVEGEGEVEPEDSEQVPSAPIRPLRIFLLMEPPLTEERESERESPPLRALPRPLPPLEDQLPAVEAPHQEDQPLPFEVASEAGPEPGPERPRQETSRGEDTEVAVESCQIMLWRGYFRYQLFAGTGPSSIARPFALSPYFRLEDADAPGAKAIAALQELLDQLEAEGWSVVLQGRRWYAFSLERPL